MNHITVQTINKKGFVKQSQILPLNSFVGNWIRALRPAIQGTTGNNTNVVRTTGTTHNPAALYFAGPAGNVSKGIVVGTGDTSVTINDFILGSRIEHGTGTGQLEYQVNNFSQAQKDDGIFTISRLFVNNSGASIEVKETGVYTSTQTFGGTANETMLVRDVLDVPQTVPDGDTLLVRYSFSFTGSLVKNAYLWFTAMSEQVTSIMRRTGVPINSQSHTYLKFADQDTADIGLKVGSGTTPYDFDDFILESKIEKGTGTGQLVHSGHAFQGATVGVNRASTIVDGSFLNESGGAIEIGEIAGYGSDSISFRHVLDEPIELAHDSGTYIEVMWHCEV